MRHRSKELAGLMLGLMLLSACAAEPTPVVKLPTPAIPVSQPPTALPTRAIAAAGDDHTATVQRGTVRAAVNASGKLESAREFKVGFGVAGSVQEILVNEGQSVKAGDVLARLNTGELQLAVSQAEQALADQQLQYSLVMTPTRSDLAAARAALASATANLDYLQGLPDPRQVEIARLQMESAKDQGRQIAQLQYELAQRGSTAAQIAAAAAQVAQAQSQLDRLLLTDERQRLLAAGPVRQAEADLQSARRRLDGAQLRAPIDGVVSSLTLALGDQVGTNPVALVSDQSLFNVLFNVDEASVGMLANGQPAVVVLAALPYQTLSGQMKSMSSVPTTVADVPGYRVVVSLDKTDVTLRSGMSANVAIIVGVSENVLVIPVWAIRTDRSTDKIYAYVKRGGQVVETEIVIGRYDSSQIEVKSGLAEGDVLAAPPRNSP